MLANMDETYGFLFFCSCCCGRGYPLSPDLAFFHQLEQSLDEPDEEEPEHDDELRHGVVDRRVVHVLNLVQNVVHGFPD